MWRIVFLFFEVFRWFEIEGLRFFSEGIWFFFDEFYDYVCEVLEILEG